MTFEATSTTTGEWDLSHSPVVVAVDGSERNRAAISWAAHEAAAHSGRLVLVTALPDHVVSRPHSTSHTEDPEVRELLDAARSAVGDVLDAGAVDARARGGAPLDVILAEAEDAALVVVGKRGLGGFARVLVGSTSIAVAGRSPVPVAIVPDAWDPRAREGLPVVLGVDPFKPDVEPARVALARAERLGVPLVAVHGWETPAVFTWDADVTTGATTEHEREAERRFDDLLATWRREHPQVVVRPMRSHDHPATAVLEAAEHAQAIVLGRHEAGLLGGFAYGSVARAVLHYATTPVIAVPAATPERWSG